MPNNQSVREVKLQRRNKLTGKLIRGKIDDQILYRLLAEEGRNQTEAAAFFGVTPAAVSKRVKALNLNLTRHVGLERAKEVADHGIDVFDQLKRINSVIQEELSWSLSEARKPVSDRKGLQKVIIDLTGEVRKQLHLQVDIARTLYDLKGIAEFQKEVLDAIGEVSPETRQIIIQKLQQRRTLRSAIDFPHPGG